MIGCKFFCRRLVIKFSKREKLDDVRKDNTGTIFHASLVASGGHDRRVYCVPVKVFSCTPRFSDTILPARGFHGDWDDAIEDAHSACIPSHVDVAPSLTRGSISDWHHDAAFPVSTGKSRSLEDPVFGNFAPCAFGAVG